MADVFISYSSKDRDRAEELAKVISDRGYSVWWDRQIPLGESYDIVIKEEISKAECVVVLWSSNSVQSDFVKEEADFGKHKGNLVPVMLDAIEIPFGFTRLQAVDLSDCDLGSCHGGVGTLLSGIDNRVGDRRTSDPSPLPKQVHQPEPRQHPVPATAASSKKFGAPMVFLALALVAVVSYIGWGQFIKNPGNGTAQTPPPVVPPIDPPKPLSQKTALFIDTDPAGAKVKIMNIRPVYKPGMELDPGSYNIRVSAAGFETQDLKIVLTGELGKTQRRVELAMLNKSPEVASRPEKKHVAVPVLPESGSRRIDRQRNADVQPTGTDFKAPGMELSEPPTLNGIYTSVQNAQRSASAQAPKTAGSGHFEVSTFFNSTNSADPKVVIRNMQQSQQSGGNSFTGGNVDASQLFRMAAESGLLADMVSMDQRMSMQRTPVTKGQWQAVMGSRLQREHEYGFYDENDPAIVQWSEVGLFLRGLNQKLKGSGHSFRLPGKTELVSRLKTRKVQYRNQSCGEWTKGKQLVERNSFALKKWHPSNEGEFRIVRVAGR